MNGKNFEIFCHAFQKNFFQFLLNYILLFRNMTSSGILLSFARHDSIYWTFCGKCLFSWTIVVCFRKICYSSLVILFLEKNILVLFRYTEYFSLVLCYCQSILSWRRQWKFTFHRITYVYFYVFQGSFVIHYC